MRKVKLSKFLAELTDSYSYRGNGYELKIVEEDGEKYIEINYNMRKQELEEIINKVSKN